MVKINQLIKKNSWKQPFLLTFVIILIIFPALNRPVFANDLEKKDLWWYSIYGAPVFIFNEKEHYFGGAGYFEFGFQFDIFDAGVAINPATIVLGLIGKFDMGIMFYETKTNYIRVSAGYGIVEVPGRKNPRYIEGGIDYGFKKEKKTYFLTLLFGDLYQKSFRDNIVYFGLGGGMRW